MYVWSSREVYSSLREPWNSSLRSILQAMANSIYSNRSKITLDTLNVL